MLHFYYHSTRPQTCHPDEGNLSDSEQRMQSHWKSETSTLAFLRLCDFSFVEMTKLCIKQFHYSNHATRPQNCYPKEGKIPLEKRLNKRLKIENFVTCFAYFLDFHLLVISTKEKSHNKTKFNRFINAKDYDVTILKNRCDCRASLAMTFVNGYVLIIKKLTFRNGEIPFSLHST